MQNLRRIKRMTRAKKNKGSGLNLVALMDIFTVLVFFLLINQSSTEELPSLETLKLPDSVAEQKPEQTIVVMVTADQILIKGEAVATVADVLAQDDMVIAVVRDILLTEAANMISVSGAAADRGREVTIMGDRLIPFKLLKKVMASCTAAGYEKISLAVQQKETKVS